jgi:hypothetical protein
MNSVINTAVASVTALVLAACVGSGTPDVQQSDQGAAQLMLVSDSTIVPGVRAGRAFLGMSEDQLYSRLGAPFRSELRDRGATVFYYYIDLTVSVNKATHRVNKIYIIGPSYSTAGGITVGTPELAVKALLGQPVVEAPLYAGDYRQRVFCYDGVQTVVKDGSINGIWVFSGQCGKSLKL